MRHRYSLLGCLLLVSLSHHAIAQSTGPNRSHTAGNYAQEIDGQGTGFVPRMSKSKQARSALRKTDRNTAAKQALQRKSPTTYPGVKRSGSSDKD